LVGFNKALRRASYLFGILVDDPHFNIDKNVYEGMFMTFLETLKQLLTLINMQ